MKKLFKNVTAVSVCNIAPDQEKPIELDADDLAGDYSTRQAIKKGWLVEVKPKKEIKPKGDLNVSSEQP